MTDSSYASAQTNDVEALSAMMLSHISFYNIAGLNSLYHVAGSAAAVIEHHNDIRQLVPEASPRLVEAFRNIDEHRRWAEDQMAWALSKGITPLPLNSADYPQRLRECPDAPIVLYYMGNGQLNAQRVICIVGTRHCTIYGKDLVAAFVRDLSKLCPGILIVSGLAYGVDICAHRNALAEGLPTVGVLAHGLDTIYPSSHRETAAEMLREGGLLTEYPSCTNADKMNFVRRNRIVAGMSDACILVESAEKGGGLITADIASSYGRDVFAFPGHVNAEYSKGCNNLIRDNKAGLITSAADFVKAMGWESDAVLQQAKSKGIERQLFPDLTTEEARVVAVLEKTNDLQMNLLSNMSGIGIGQLSSLLFTLEMKGVIKTLAGGVCHLCQ